MVKLMYRWLAVILIGGFSFCVDAVSEKSNSTTRIQSGLQALYDFRSNEGAVVYDRSGVGETANLKIHNSDAVRRSNGSLEVLKDTRIVSEKPPKKIIESVLWSGELSVEAWITPANTKQDGPARIITISKNNTQRNFTLGQDGNKYDFRLRTTETSGNGIPSINSNDDSLTTEKTHVVYTRNRNGRARIYLNGNLANEETVSGEMDNWDGSFQLGLANEINDSRPWQGTYHLVAIYNRNLLPHEVEQNYKAGTDAQSLMAQNSRDTSAHLFESKVAPLLVNRCFECHDSSTKEGGLDLTKKAMAFAGGKGGKAIVPGKPKESPLYTILEFDLMPYEREPLSKQEKQAIREWIGSGAKWTTGEIDPSLYAHGSESNDVWVRRLTVTEYINTVQSTVGVDIEKEAKDLLPKDLRADGFSNTAYNLNIDLKHVEAYAKLAEIIVDRMDVVKFAKPYSKNKRLTDDNMRDLVANMGKWVLRGPLSGHEVDVFRGISTTVASAGGDFKEAVTYILEAMLQSPRFIYRIENQRGDGTHWPVNQYELASRLSYIIWGSSPDKQLMKAADDGDLYERSEVAEQVKRMLKDPRAVERSSQFLAEWLNLGGLENLRPNKEKFPNWDPKLASDMQDESLAFFEFVVWVLDRPLSDLFDAQITFLTSRLAKHYGIEPKEHDSDDSPGKMRRYDLRNVHSRGGLMTQGSVLTKGGDEASMVTRGLFVLHDVLRGSVQDPPPCVDTSPVPTEPGLTKRGIAEQRIANPACGGCHKKFEPLAFGLEKFDGLGTYHEVDEHGNKLRDDGEILIPGKEKPVFYDTSAEMVELLANSERVEETITWKMAQFALGRSLDPQDARILKDVHEKAQKQGGTYKDFISAIAVSDLVRMTKTEAYK